MCKRAALPLPSLLPGADEAHRQWGTSRAPAEAAGWKLTMPERLFVSAGRGCSGVPSVDAGVPALVLVLVL